jgi:carboxymethylenebutenolidase
MGLKSEWVRCGADGRLGYLCVPERANGPLPAVVVIQEAWGVNEHIQSVTRRVALAGYVALAPDLFAENGVRPAALGSERLDELLALLNRAPAALMDPAARAKELAGRPEAERSRVEETVSAVMTRISDRPRFVPAAHDAVRFLREQTGTVANTGGQPVGVLGFCLGGGVAGLLATEDPDLGGAVVFYGAPPPPELVPRIACPVLGIYGALDQRVTSQVPAFEEAMARAGRRFEKIVCEGAGHAFFNESRPSYDVRASREVWPRALSFLRSTLAP